MGWIALLIGGALYIVLLIRFPVQIIAITAIVIAVPVGIIWKEHSDTEKRNKLAEHLILVAIYDPTICPANYLAVGIKNQTGKAVGKVSWKFEARRPGFSNDLVSGYRRYESDKILQPGDTYKACYAMPQLGHGAAPNPESIEWSISNRYVTFQK